MHTGIVRSRDSMHVGSIYWQSALLPSSMVIMHERSLGGISIYAPAIRTHGSTAVRFQLNLIRSMRMYLGL